MAAALPTWPLLSATGGLTVPTDVARFEALLEDLGTSVEFSVTHVPRTVQTACDPGLGRLEKSFGIDVSTDPDPIWDWGHTGLHLFPSAIQMAAFLLSATGRELVRGRRVLELGCGMGLLGPVAALGGAAAVVLTDFDPLVLDLCRHNQERNARALGEKYGAISVQALDWRHVREDESSATVAWTHLNADCGGEPAAGRAIDDVPKDPVAEEAVRQLLQGIDVILATDVVYDAGLSRALLRVLLHSTSINPAIDILLGVQYREDDPSENNSSIVERILESMMAPQVEHLVPLSSDGDVKCPTEGQGRARSRSPRRTSQDRRSPPGPFQARRLTGEVGLQASALLQRLDGGSCDGAGFGTSPTLEVWLLRRSTRAEQGL